MIPVVLIHGAACTPGVWDPLIAQLPGFAVVAPSRRCSGSLEDELRHLRDAAEGGLIVGMSGGATIALALAASPIQIAGAIAHEPAVGSLVPGLLKPFADAFAADGVAGFGAALYGPLWERAPELDRDAVERDLAMFRSFEPSPMRPGQGPVLVTTGRDSLAVRHLAAARLHATFGFATSTIPNAAHFVAKENPVALAALVRAMHAGLTREKD